MGKESCLAYTLLLCITLATIEAANAQTSTIYVYPTSKTINAPGQLFTIDINIANAPPMDFYAIQNITWNPDVIELQHGNYTDIVEGSFLKRIPGSETVIVATVEPGRISDMGCGFLTNSTTEGNGTLFSIKFRSKGTGNSNIEIGYAYILDMGRDPEWFELPNLKNGTVIVQIPSPVGGYSFSMGEQTAPNTSNTYATLLAILTVAFTAIKSKTHRRTKHS